MKKIISLLIALAMVLGIVALTACGDKETPTTPQRNPPQQQAQANQKVQRHLRKQPKAQHHLPLQLTALRLLPTRARQPLPAKQHSPAKKSILISWM